MQTEKAERAGPVTLRLTQAAAITLAVLFLASASIGCFLWWQRNRAQASVALARHAVDEVLSAAEHDPTPAGDLPQVEEFRRELLSKAQHFYGESVKGPAFGEAARRDLAFGHLRLGHINRLMLKPDEAIREYHEAIARFESLAAAHPANADYRAALGTAYHWLGQTLRPLSGRAADADNAYDAALGVQQPLIREWPQNAQSTEDLARTFYNRGVLHATMSGRQPAADADFREAIRLLEPLASASDRAAQALARASDRLASLYYPDLAYRFGEAQALWEEAIAIEERLSIRDPSNREYKIELATYCRSLAALLQDRDQFLEADRRSREAVDLIEALARVVPSLAIARADAHSLRGRVLRADDVDESQQEYAVSLDLFDPMHNDANLRRLPEFHRRLADLTLNLTVLPRGGVALERARELLARAVTMYADMAFKIAVTGSKAEAQMTLDGATRILPSLPDPERERLTAAVTLLQRKIDEDGARR